MQIEAFKYEDVLPDGTFQGEEGQIEVNGKIIMSQKGGGCSEKNCTCSEGHWISIIHPRTENGLVFGIKVIFMNEAEMQKFLDSRELICTPPHTLN